MSVIPPRDDGPDPDDAKAPRLYLPVLAWGVVTLALLWWFARHFRV